MAKYKIAWLPGDGVGVEILQAARIVLDKLNLDAEYIHGDIGWEFWQKEGDAFPERTINLLHNVDTALFGAITSKPIKASEAELAPELKGKGLVYRSPIVRMRQLFDLYTCLRPIKAYPGNNLNYREGINLVVFRENTEDLYAGVEFSPVPVELSELLKKLARSRSRRFSNLRRSSLPFRARSIPAGRRSGLCGLRLSSPGSTTGKRSRSFTRPMLCAQPMVCSLKPAGRWRQDYPEIVTDDANIDAMTMWLLKNPFNYDVLVAPNLYGDIVSDLCAQMVGGLGFGCSGNIGDRLAVFEPTHGSAPKYSGMMKVNPIATILAAKMMLDWLGEKDKADRLEAAVAAVIREGKARTYDMGGNNTTMEMAQAIAGKLA